MIGQRYLKAWTHHKCDDSQFETNLTVRATTTLHIVIAAKAVTLHGLCWKSCFIVFSLHFFPIYHCKLTRVPD